MNVPHPQAQSTGGGSSPSVWHAVATLWHLETIRTTYRVKRFLARLGSPRQAFASMLAIGFVALYLLAGLTVLARRDVVDPSRLQLWLSGGMVCYAIYHAIKYAWSKSGGMSSVPLTGSPLTPAMGLWIHGGPLPRDIVSLHEVVRLVPSTAAKTSLLCVVLYRDVPSLVCLWVGVFSALFTLEWIRRLISQFMDALNTRERKVIQGVAALVAIALVAQIGTQTWNRTPAGSDPAQYMVSMIGEAAEFAMSAPVQWLATPLQPASHLAVCQPMQWAALVFPTDWIVLHAGLSLVGTFGWIAVVLFAYVRLDHWSLTKRHANEQLQLQQFIGGNSSLVGHPGRFQQPDSVSRSGFARLFSKLNAGRRFDLFVNPGVAAVFVRQWHCVVRYRASVIVSFAIPMIVSLSPLLTNDSALAGKATRQWMFVIGGIALSTLLLAPPALQIDFRRDLKRMWLLRAFPIRPLAMCVAMISMPVLITSLFQWATLGLAYSIAGPPIYQVVWLAITLPALATMTFAIENALFLTFPHHVHDQGIAMVIRAKVTFLWKGVLLLLFPALLYAWTLLCVATIPADWCPEVAYVGSILGFWMMALTSIAVCVWAWGRFDPAADTPAE
ncbi:hypothetical protein SAMN06265222_105256 [Neorhodopirellula lusitana]|uniref:Uncharacterized protein n=1 Tax=Neorhodopirellula lusitana TaxID=445327 RepID=A0ABY1Q2B1_9BACT|nr:hypothetical protein [Neorhodopirellula lusitana]SMP57072.1 hypothetical protein SAMN06265222_105256 [Neorhodopirellula lusitana]